VPGHPEQAAVCHYTDDRLGHSTVVSGGRFSRLIGLLNGLTPGLKRSSSFARDVCPQEDREGYVVRFFYRSGPPLDVFIHLFSCDHLGADTGARTGGFTLPFAESFFTQIDPGFGGAITGGVH
jgi:hypothetical protein